MNISIILAAGEGTRMNSKTSKVLHNICGKPMLSYIIESSKGANIGKNVVIVGHSGDKVKDYFDDQDIIFKTQAIGENLPYGTGFAVMQAIDEIDDDSTVAILSGDTPLIREDTIKNLVNYHEDKNCKATVLTAILEDCTGYGRIIRGKDGNILKIVEEKDATEDERKVNEINSGIYCFNGKLLKDALSKIDNENAQNEYYITDVIGILKEQGYSVGAYTINDAIEINGVNSRVQLAYCERVMRKRINKLHMENGVTMINPENTYIEDSVRIGKDTTIYPGVILEGSTEIGENCLIRQDSRIVNSIIKDNVIIESSVIEESFVDDNTKIGPSAHLRPNSKIGKNIKIGNYVEVKNSTIGDNTKAGHLTYIGDADIGYNVNIGCGVVFVNYDGRDKFRSTVGDNCFIGSNSNLVAPVEVEDWGYIAAGSTVTKLVETGALSIARAHQVNKEGWVEKKGYKKD